MIPTEGWFGFLGPNDWFGQPGRPIYHLVDEEFAARFAEAHLDTLVWVAPIR